MNCATVIPNGMLQYTVGNFHYMAHMEFVLSDEGGVSCFLQTKAVEKDQSSVGIIRFCLSPTQKKAGFAVGKPAFFICKHAA